MMRRRPAPFALLAVACVSIGWPSLAWASTITYELKNTSVAGTTPVDQVIANVTPPGLIDTIDTTPPSPYGPLTILPGSQGFDKNQLLVSVGHGTIPQGQPGAGNPYQLLLLTFENGGLAPGGVLDFSLKLNQPGATPPQLELPPTSTGLTIAQITSSPTTPVSQPSNNPPTQNTPEPLSLVLWSALAGAGMLRARRVRLANLTRE